MGQFMMMIPVGAWCVCPTGFFVCNVVHHKINTLFSQNAYFCSKI